MVWRPYQVTFQKPLQVEIPSHRLFVGALAVELLVKGGKRIAANFINLICRPLEDDGAVGGVPSPSGASPRVEVLAPRLVALRFDPDDFASYRSKEPTWDWRHRRGKYYLQCSPPHLSCQ